jgi:hypothetical protein
MVEYVVPNGNRTARGLLLTMAAKQLKDLKTFIENVNKKNKEHNGRRIRFSWVKRKRRMKK